MSAQTLDGGREARGRVSVLYTRTSTNGGSGGQRHHGGRQSGLVTIDDPRH